MGYFASLMRQTGISIGGAVSRPVPVARGLEADETRVAQPPPAEVAPHPYPAPVAPHPDVPPLLSPGPTTVWPEASARPAEVAAAPAPQETTSSPGRREMAVEIPSPPRTEIREYRVELERRAPDGAAARLSIPASTLESRIKIRS